MQECWLVIINNANKWVKYDMIRFDMLRIDEQIDNYYELVKSDD